MMPSLERLRRAAAGKGASLEAALQLADALRASGCAAEAIDWYRQAASRGPDLPLPHAALGSALQDVGQLEEAESSYLEAVRLAPNFAPALCNLGAVQKGLGKLDEARTSLERAVAADPQLAESHSNLGTVLQEQGRLEEARASYERAVAINPNHLEAHTNLGNLLLQQDDPEQAIEHLQRVVAAKPDFVAVWLNLAAAQRRAGHLPQAAASYCQAIVLQPASAGAWVSLGEVYGQDRDFDAALECCRQAIALDPRLPSAHCCLGNTLAQADRLDEAAESYEQALAIDPRFAPALSNRGTLLSMRGDLEGALASCQLAADIDPEVAANHSNLGLVYHKMGRIDAAIGCYQRALSRHTSHVAAHTNLAAVLVDHGSALLDANRTDEAVKQSRQALAVDPACAEAHFNLSRALLTAGQFREGWAEHEWRWHCQEFGQKLLQGLEWRGEDVRGKTLLLYAEQGIGDSLQFARYVPLLRERGARTLLACPRSLLRLFSHADVADVVIEFEVLAQKSGPDIEREYEPNFCAALMSLPHLFQTTLETAPAHVPYIAAPASLVEEATRRLPADGTLRVGLVWAANPSNSTYRQRSMPLDCLMRLSAVPGVSLFSLQKEQPPEDVARWASAGAITDLSPGLSDFADTAAAIAQLDLVVSVDTAVAHLAGAMGRPVWTMLPFAADFRWLLDRDDTPWYPTMRLFRQTASADWDGVVDRLATDLRALGQRTLSLSHRGGRG